MALSAQLLQFLVTGLSNGCIYGLVALGFTIIYAATGIINFAQGEFVMLGGLLVVTLLAAGLPLAAACLGAVVVVTLVGCLLERLAIRPLRSAPVITMIIVTIGASVLLRGAALAIWGTGSHRVEPFSGEESLAFAGATVRPQDLWVAGTMAVALLAVYLFFRFTVTGMAMRACAINRRAARLVGISVERMNLLSFGLSAALGGLAGVVFSPLTMPQYATGTALALKGFCGAIVGGLGNSAGAVVGGLLLGVVEAIGAGFAPEYLHIPSGYKDAFALVILLLVLLLRPRGLLGARHQEGV